MISFIAAAPFIKRLRSDGGYRLELDVPASEFQNLVALQSPSLDGITLRVTIEQSDDGSVAEKDPEQF